MTPRRRLRVLVVAEESAGVQVLESLTRAPEVPEVVAVVTATEPAESRRPVVAVVAARLGLDVWPVSDIGKDDFADRVRHLDVDLLLNIHSLHVLRDVVVQAPAVGSFNLHPGPLPEYAGLNAPSWAIYEGRTTHAVTLHWMDAGVDTGAIAYRSAFAIDERDTGLSLTAKCIRNGVPLVLRLIRDASTASEAIPALAQDPARRRYFGREVPNDGKVEWGWRAVEVVRFVRAADYYPFPSPWGAVRARRGNSTIGIAKAATTAKPVSAPPGTVGDALPGGAVTVAARDEWVVVQRVWCDGRYVRAVAACPPGTKLDDG